MGVQVPPSAPNFFEASSKIQPVNLSGLNPRLARFDNGCIAEKLPTQLTCRRLKLAQGTEANGLDVA
jgi:hypothetical protein